MESYTYYKRGKCACGYVWTTGVTQSVVCKCSTGIILDGSLINLSPVTDEDEFLTAVSSDTGIPKEEIILIDGSA